jgi:hypothetical protein
MLHPISGPYILLRVYLDAFACNNPIGSASGKHKIMGYYYSVLNDLVVSSNRKTLQTISLILQSDIDFFGLDVCLINSILQLKTLVEEGIFDHKTQRNIQVRVMGKISYFSDQNVVICKIEIILEQR